MRGADQPQALLFSYVSVEDRIPADHLLRTIHALVNPILATLSPRVDALYARMGRPGGEFETITKWGISRDH